MGEAELAWTSFLNSIRVFDLSRGQCISDGKQHPTQKAMSLMRWCLGFAPDAITILDPFAGSGTTGVAAKLEGRKATLIELEERYCEITAKRLAQGVLF
jgi:DNA modification methylase